MESVEGDEMLFILCLLLFTVAFALITQPRRSRSGRGLQYKSSKTDASQVTNEVLSVRLHEIELSFLNPIRRKGIRTYFSTTKNQVYSIDLDAASCTCPDFQKGRSTHSVLDVRRNCRHLASYGKYRASQSLSVQSDLAIFCVDQNLFFPDQAKFYMEVIKGNRAFIVSDFLSPWCDVYTRKLTSSDGILHTGKIDRYGYNCIEHRWSYGEAPRNAVAFRRVLDSIPKSLNLESENVVWEDLSLETFLSIKADLIASNNIVDYILDLISKESSLDLIHASLMKLEKVEGISFVELASVWANYGQLLEGQENPHSVEFYEKAASLDREFCWPEKVDLAAVARNEGEGRLLEKSLYEFQMAKWEESERQNDENVSMVVEKCRAIIDADAEYAAFIALKETSLKQLAEKELDLSVPKWPLEEYRGYQYADLVREEVARGELLRKSKENVKVLDYVLSLAVMTGQMSPAVFALMLKYKGMIAEAGQHNEHAIVYYELALLLDKRIGVKRRLDALRKLGLEVG